MLTHQKMREEDPEDHLLSVHACPCWVRKLATASLDFTSLSCMLGEDIGNSFISLPSKDPNHQQNHRPGQNLLHCPTPSLRLLLTPPENRVSDRAFVRAPMGPTAMGTSSLSAAYVWRPGPPGVPNDPRATCQAGLSIPRLPQDHTP